ncbi:MAG: bifunctional aspartate kinase/homoserine dehydrogenase I [Bacteroidia bacterium]|nr:bifunctional aspartate kinase/homoserine dehydrogenase I [Bacteroidia bacterium]
MKVLKFGGTSVANAAVIRKVKEIVTGTNSQLTAVVVSAMGGVTDLLIKSAMAASDGTKAYKDFLTEIKQRHYTALEELLGEDQEDTKKQIDQYLTQLDTLLEGATLTGEMTPRLLDKIISHGELMSATQINAFFKQEGLPSSFKDSRELILTNETFGGAQVYRNTSYDNCDEFAKDNPSGICVFPGFIGATERGETTTLGRGGSDFTAALLAAGFGADELQIWTDVSGMFTANPKLVRQARAIPRLSYEEAMELSHFGAKVLYPPTIQPVLEKQIPIRIKNTFEPEDEGTLIAASTGDNGKTVRGISYIPDISLLSLEGPGMVGIPGISKRFFEVLSHAGINISLITQASSEHSICLGLNTADVHKAEKLTNEAFEFEIGRKQIKPVIVETNLAIIALVGDQMKSHQGLSGKMFSTLGRNNVNIRAIAQGASERNISAVIDRDDVKKALNTLHEAFFEEQTRQLNLFVVGVGNVGRKFLDQLQNQSIYLKDHLKIRIRIIGISNSRTMVFNEHGIDLKDWESALSKGIAANLEDFFRTTRELNLRNSILVDNTASAEVAVMYPNYLKENIAVVTCNKIACSSSMELYRELKDLSREFNAPFLFETNVGAGLPIIDTLKNLIVSGDTVIRIEAVLSGSLNFIFNHFNDQTTFHDVVKRAHTEGYTEPDPRIDLSGTDVMRKILILARESGYDMEMTAIDNLGFLPQKCLDAPSVESFYESLKEEEAHFQDLWKEAGYEDSSLKYVARFSDGKAEVALQKIPVGHEFEGLKGSDNVVLFYTNRYPEQPLMVKGAGAGAEVTASGIFADIIRIGNF